MRLDPVRRCVPIARVRLHAVEPALRQKLEIRPRPARRQEGHPRPAFRHRAWRRSRVQPYYALQRRPDGVPGGHFTNQIKFWGIQPSYAFVEQPQTNGVAERFNRTLKEQIIHGRIYRNIAELRNAVRGFVEQYNAQWIVQKNGYLSPAQARQAWHTAMSLRPAA